MTLPASDAVVLGFRVRFRAIMPARQRRILGAMKLQKPQGEPELTVQFVKSLRAVKKSPNTLFGEGFALDFDSRLLFYPGNAERLVVSRKGGTAHILIHRAIIFSLALLAEANGWQNNSKRVPLYLHASAVATPKGALVFCGDSTFGKSTISGKLLSDYPKLDDDQVMLLVDPGGKAKPQVVVFAENAARLLQAVRTPNRSGTIPVAGLFWLKKGPHFSIEPVATAGAVSLLMYPMASWEKPHAILNRMRCLHYLLSRTPCRQLEFRKEKLPLIALLRQHRCM